MNPKHLSKSVEHFSPPEIVAAARKVMGGIDLDPASCPLANKLVRARKYYTRKDDGFARPWSGRVWLNPPGGLTADRASSARMWWEKLVFEYAQKRVTQAVFVAFARDELQRTQKSLLPSVGKFPFCIPEERLCFYVEKGEQLVPGKDPTHANAIVYLGNNVADFAIAFGKLGDVMLPYGGAL